MPNRAVAVCLVVSALLALAAMLAVGSVLMRPIGKPSCPSHLKQVCLAEIMYCGDYDGRFPPHQDWSSVLEPYLKDRWIYVCPQAPRVPIGYAYRGSLEFRPVKSVGPADKTIVFWDRQPETELPAFRHGEGLWAGYVDGHVKWLKEEAFFWARPRGQ